MQVIIAFMLLGALVVFLGTAVVGFFNSGASKVRKELKSERVRSTLAQTALREISAGAEMPVFVASDALAEINKTYTSDLKELN